MSEREDKKPETQFYNTTTIKYKGRYHLPGQLEMPEDAEEQGISRCFGPAGAEVHVSVVSAIKSQEAEAASAAAVFANHDKRLKK